MNVQPGRRLTFEDLGVSTPLESKNTRERLPSTSYKLPMQTTEKVTKITDEEVEVGDYFLVQFENECKNSKHKYLHYVGRVIEKGEKGKLKMSYYRKTDIPKGKELKNLRAFKEPENVDVSEISCKKLVKKLIVVDVYKRIRLFTNNFGKILIK